MRRFVVEKPSGNHDEGCLFTCGAVALVQDHGDGSYSWRFVDGSFIEHHYGELRFVDPDGAPPPPEQTGVLPGDDERTGG